MKTTFFPLESRSARVFDRRLIAANQNPSPSSNNHSPGIPNAALAAFRHVVDVAVILGFRSTPQNGSRFSLLLPRMAARAMACMTPGPFLQPGKMPVPDLHCSDRLCSNQTTSQQSPSGCRAKCSCRYACHFLASCATFHHV